MNELIKIGQIQISGEEVNSVDARELHSFLGSKQDFSNWIDRKVVSNPFFVKNSDFIVYSNIIENTEETKGGRPKIDYALTIDTAKKVAMSEQTEKGNDVRDYFIQCEKIALKPRELTTLEIFQRAIESEKARLKAIKEKAWIGNAREASAMNKASQLSKVNQKLLDEIGDGKNFKQVKAISWLKEFFNLTDTMYQQVGKQLSAISKEYRLTTKLAESSEYGTVKTYDIQAINILKDRLTENYNLLGNYRKKNGVRQDYAVPA